MKIKTGQGNMTLQKLIAIYSISMVTSLPGLAISPIWVNWSRYSVRQVNYNCKCWNRYPRLSSFLSSSWQDVCPFISIQKIIDYRSGDIFRL